jgi:hypothetical protein
MDNSASNVAANTTNSPYMSMFVNPVFGNMAFQILPSQIGSVNNMYGTIPYLPLESLIQQQQMSAQIDPTKILSGQQQGNQNIQGSLTVQDAFGNARLQMGYQQGGF